MCRCRLRHPRRNRSYRDRVIPPAAADCEAIGSGFLAQPVNALSTLAFVIAGVWVWQRGQRRSGALIAATGIGSFLFHGPLPNSSEWIHDTTLMLVLLDVLQPRRFWYLGLALAAGFWAVPAAADSVTFGVAMGALVLVGLQLRSKSLPAFALVGLGGAIGQLSKTGAPWCHPDSWLQGHAFWHVAAAASLALLVAARTRPFQRRS